MRLPIRCATLLAAVVVAGGCAYSGRPVEQAIRVETPGCERATCTLGNEQGQWSVSTPGTVTVRTARTPLTVSCRADGGVLGRAETPSTTAPNTGAGAVAGGVAGGAAVGAAVGSAALSFIPVVGVIVVATGVAIGATGGSTIEHTQTAMRYPERIEVPMNCALPAPADAVPAGLTVRGLSRDEAAAAGVGGAVRVMAVVPGGRAALAGLQAGDLVVAAGGAAIDDPAQLEALLRALPAGATLALRVRRGGADLEIALTGVPRPVAK